MEPIRLKGLQSDWQSLQEIGPGATIMDMQVGVAARNKCMRQMWVLLKREPMPHVDANTIADPMVHLTSEWSVATSAFLPSALAGADRAQTLTSGDLSACALVCTSWAGWIRRMLREPEALSNLWRRIFFGYLDDLSIGPVLHPELAGRVCLRTALEEQALRDSGILDDESVGIEEPETLMMDVMPGIANLWAFLVNSLDGGCRYHGWDMSPEDLHFRPYLYPTGRYSVDDLSEEGHLEDLRTLILGFMAAINDYADTVVANEDIESNLLLAAVLQPALRQTRDSIPQYLGIDFGAYNQALDDGDLMQLRPQLTAERVTKFARALSCFACLFPQEADVNATKNDYGDAGESLVAWGTPLNAGNVFNDLLELDDEAESMPMPMYKFKVQARRRDYPVGHPLWKPPFLQHIQGQGGGNAMQIG